MTTRTKHHIPWYLWPIVALWQLVATIIELVGRFVAILLGFVLFVVGAVVSLTIVGAIVGIPLMLFGGMLVLKGMF
jgi:hypothetical protein